MSLSCSETYRNLQKDDDCFNLRLQEISREIEVILVKTAQQREDLLGRSQASPLRHVIEGNLQDISGPAVAIPEMIPSNLFNEGVAVKQQQKQFTENQLLALLEPLVETKVHQILQGFIGKVERTQNQQEETENSMIALSEDYREQRRMMQNSLTLFKHQTSRLQHFETDFKDHEQRCQERLTLINDSLGALNEKSQLSEQRAVRRLDELVKNHHETVLHSLTDMETHVHQWKGDVESLVYRQVSDWRLWSDELEAHVARLQGVLGSVAETVNKHTVDLRNLMETVLEKHSEIRSCRRDVNRLEMLIHCGGNLLYTGKDREIAAVEGYFDRIPLIDGVKGSEPSSMVSFRELSHVKDQVNFLSCRIEDLERCFGKLGSAHIKVDSNFNGGGMNSDRATLRRLDHAELLNRSNHHDSAAERMSNSVPFRSMPSMSSMVSPSERQAKGIKTMTNNATARLLPQDKQTRRKTKHYEKNYAFSSSQPYEQTPLTSVNTSTLSHSERQLTHFNVREHGGIPRNSTPENPVECVGEIEAGIRNYRKNKPYVHDKLYPLQCSSATPLQAPSDEARVDEREDPNIPDTINKQEGSSLFLAPMHKNTPFPEYNQVAQNRRHAADDDVDTEEVNSYQSRTESPMYHKYFDKEIHDNGRIPPIHQDQYLPAPVSDSESERINYKLSRLAID
ncbi:unnamed protein product [Phytomonas sp. Hart1]|nr:unnamed protein product [Phytomonas sp. Hart1]|eukprot:CCW68877.1 unnamed protein product [Phytomonas sp. isolate Hart1]